MKSISSLNNDVGDRDLCALRQQGRGSDVSHPTPTGVALVKAIRLAQERKAHVLDKSKTCGLSEVAVAGSIARTDPTGERAETASHDFDLTWNRMGWQR